MFILRIEHPVPDFGAWKAAFDADPIGRTSMKVRHYRVMQPIDNDRFTVVDLEFESVADAEACLAALRGLWANVQGTVMSDPQVRIVEVLESRAP